MKSCEKREVEKHVFEKAWENAGTALNRTPFWFKTSRRHSQAAIRKPPPAHRGPPSPNDRRLARGATAAVLCDRRLVLSADAHSLWRVSSIVEGTTFDLKSGKRVGSINFSQILFLRSLKSAEQLVLGSIPIRSFIDE